MEAGIEPATAHMPNGALPTELHHGRGLYLRCHLHHDRWCDLQ